MHAQARPHPAGPAGAGHVDRRRRESSQCPVRGRRAMTQHSAAAAGEDGSQAMASGPEHGVPDRVHPSMQADQQPATDASFDLRDCHAGREQLQPLDDAVLTRRELRDDRVDRARGKFPCHMHGKRPRGLKFAPRRYGVTAPRM